MRRALARSIVTFAALVVAWLVASPAFAASAPQCDVRGAITFAPPPQLQPIEQSLDVDDGAPSCVERYLADAGVHQGNAPPPAASMPDPATTSDLPLVLPAAPEGLVVPAAATFAPPAGVRARVDRPPRV